MMPFEIHPEAQDEYDEVLDYLEEIDPEYAHAFTAHVDAALRHICEHPESFSVRVELVRRANLRPRFGEYYLPYLQLSDRVAILAVAHAKRRPHYWRERIQDYLPPGNA